MAPSSAASLFTHRTWTMKRNRYVHRFLLFYNTPVVRSIRCFGAIHKYRNNTILTVCHDMYTYFRQVLQIYGQRSDEVATRHNSNSVFCDLPCDMENPALLVTGTCNIHDILFSYLDSSRFFFIFLDDHLA